MASDVSFISPDKSEPPPKKSKLPSKGRICPKITADRLKIDDSHLRGSHQACPVCGKDLTALSQIRRAAHVNGCIDSDANKQALELAKKESVTMFTCPSCLETVAKGPYLLAHAQKCSKVFNIPIEKMITSLETQCSVEEQRRKAGFAKAVPVTAEMISRAKKRVLEAVNSAFNVNDGDSDDSGPSTSKPKSFRRPGAALMKSTVFTSKEPMTCKCQVLHILQNRFCDLYKGPVQRRAPAITNPSQKPNFEVTMTLKNAKKFERLTRLADDFKMSFKAQKTDVILAARDGVVLAHSFVIRARSTMTPSPQNPEEIDVSTYSKAAVELYLSYLYSAAVDWTLAEAPEIRELAETFGPVDLQLFFFQTSQEDEENIEVNETIFETTSTYPMTPRKRSASVFANTFDDVKVPSTPLPPAAVPEPEIPRRRNSDDCASTVALQIDELGLQPLHPCDEVVFLENSNSGSCAEDELSHQPSTLTYQSPEIRGEVFDEVFKSPEVTCTDAFSPAQPNKLSNEFLSARLSTLTHRSLKVTQEGVLGEVFRSPEVTCIDASHARAVESSDDFFVARMDSRTSSPVYTQRPRNTVAAAELPVVSQQFRSRRSSSSSSIEVIEVEKVVEVSYSQRMASGTSMNVLPPGLSFEKSSGREKTNDKDYEPAVDYSQIFKSPESPLSPLERQLQDHQKSIDRLTRNIERRKALFSDKQAEASEKPSPTTPVLSKRGIRCSKRQPTDLFASDIDKPAEIAKQSKRSESDDDDICFVKEVRRTEAKPVKQQPIVVDAPLPMAGNSSTSPSLTTTTTLTPTKTTSKYSEQAVIHRSLDFDFDVDRESAVWISSSPIKRLSPLKTPNPARRRFEFATNLPSSQPPPTEAPILLDETVFADETASQPISTPTSRILPVSPSRLSLHELPRPLQAVMRTSGKVRKLVDQLGSGVKVLKTRNVSPMPDYSKETDEQLKSRIASYGLRPMGRKRAIQMLTKIYNETHPIIDDVDPSAADSTPKTTKQPQKRARKTAKTTSTMNLPTSTTTKEGGGQPRSGGLQRSMSDLRFASTSADAAEASDSQLNTSGDGEMVEESIRFDGDEHEPTTATAATTLSSPTKSKLIRDVDEGARAFVEWLRLPVNDELYTAVLGLQTIPYDDIVSAMANSGHRVAKVTKKVLPSVLDRLHITFTYPEQWNRGRY